MVKKTKGIQVISNELLEKFKFTRDGESFFGTSLTDVHSIKGSTVTNSVDLEGALTLDNRISDTLFGAPQIAGTSTDDLQHLKDNATEYEGFIVYLTTPSSIAPFTVEQKFYFCEDGTWHPSPFRSVDVDADGDGIPDTEDPFVTETSPAGEVSVVFMTNNTTNLQNDPIFEADASGDVMIDASPSGTNGNFEIDDQGDVMPASS